MKLRETDSSTKEALKWRAAAIFEEQQQNICKHTDQMFAVLMALQWLAGIAAAYWISAFAQTWTTRLDL